MDRDMKTIMHSNFELEDGTLITVEVQTSGGVPIPAQDVAAIRRLLPLTVGLVLDVAAPDEPMGGE